MVDLKLIGQSIGQSFREMKYLHFYTHTLFPLTIIPSFLFVVGFYYMSFFFSADKNYPVMVSVMAVLGILMILLFYYVQNKTSQYAVYRTMDNLTKTAKTDADKEKLKQLDENMQLLQNRGKLFWLGFVNYIVLFLLFALVEMLIYGFSRIMYYSFLQSFVATLLTVFLYPYILSLNAQFFSTLNFYKTFLKIKETSFFNWALTLLISFIVMAVAFVLLAVFPYLFALYFGIAFSFIIIFSQFVAVNSK